MKFTKTDEYEFLKKIFMKDMFLNVYIHGEKGCGKTATILALHEEIGKEVVRVNVSIETDEDALIGRVRLMNGETYFEKGPVIHAMEEGKTLLLDEIDLGHPQRLMCLQSILEGNGYFIKKTNEMIKPKKGFRVIATANTKGSGDDTGNYIGTQYLNGAMIDRFSIFYEFKYAPADVEVEMLKLHRQDIPYEYGKAAKDSFLVNLVKWANQIRKNPEFVEYGVSTRKLIDILKTYAITEEEMPAIRLGISAYPADIIDGYVNAYDLLVAEEANGPAPAKKKINAF